MIDTPHRREIRLESEATGRGSRTEADALSIAITIERIADTIDGTTVGIRISETLLEGWTHGR